MEKQIRAACLCPLLVLVVACDGEVADPTVGPDAGGRADDAGTRPDEDAGSALRDAGGDAGTSTFDAGGITPPPLAVSCAQTTARIAATAGRTISVRPAGDGQVTVDGRTTTLRSVVSEAAEGDTILLEDGTYLLPEASPGGFSGLYFRTPGVTLRSASGDATRVIIDSAYRRHGGGSGTITIDAPNVVVAHVTLQRSIYHLIHLWADGDDALLHDVRFVDGGQQFLKASPGDAARVDRVEVSCSRFLMTPAGRDNVWGYGAQDGHTACYTGGIDAHDARDWHVHDCFFEGIYCDAAGVARPAHGQNPEERGSMTYQGGLAEHAIHMWDSEAGSGHTIERNHIVNCARGIGLGFRTEVYGSLIRNNMIFSAFPNRREHDVGIMLERVRDSQVVHNTIFYSSADAYPNAIEYRFASTSNLDIHHNLTNGRLHTRDGAAADLRGNVVDAAAAWFREPSVGDLHLASCDNPAVSGAADRSPFVTVDIDGEPREGSFDIGADQCPE